VQGVDGCAVTPRESRWRMVLPELAGTGPLPAACPSEADANPVRSVDRDLAASAAMEA
jgi:hypothetical protein